MQVVKALGTGHLESHQGRHFQLENVSMRPVPVQEGGVPVLFACHLRAKREAQFRRAARLGDGFISISEPPSEFAEVGRRVAKHAAELGRDPAEMERVFYMTVNLNTDATEAEREADKFIRLYYGVNIWRDLWGPWGPPERLAESIRAYEAAGATTVISAVRLLQPVGAVPDLCRRSPATVGVGWGNQEPYWSKKKSKSWRMNGCACILKPRHR